MRGTVFYGKSTWYLVPGMQYQVVPTECYSTGSGGYIPCPVVSSWYLVSGTRNR